MVFSEVIFYFFALLTAVFAIYIVWTNNVLYAAFALLGALFCVAAIFVFSSADFLAVAQILIYIGGTLVLIMFGIMLTNRSGVFKKTQSESRLTVPGWIAGFSLLFILFLGIFTANFTSVDWIAKASQNNLTVQKSTVSDIGILLMTDYILMFELAALILLIALIGAAMVAFRNNKTKI